MEASGGWRLGMGDMLDRVERRDMVLLAVLTPAFLIARWLLERLVFMVPTPAIPAAELTPVTTPRKPLATSLLPAEPRKSSSTARPSAPRARARRKASASAAAHKMTDALWKLLCYGSFVLCSALITASQPWFLDTRQYWVGWPDQPGTAPLRVMCIAQLAFYISSMVILGLWEVKRSDNAVMMFHHCMTVVLVGACYTCDYSRAGTVIMLLHDVNDVIMEAAKITSYLDMAHTANALFVAFAVSWVATRMLAFPAVMYSTMFESVQVIGYVVPAYWLINGLFCVLYCIHCYWFSLIVASAVRMLRAGAVEDVRED